jgi:hypothetical protein
VIVCPQQLSPRKVSAARTVLRHHDIATLRQHSLDDPPIRQQGVGQKNVTWCNVVVKQVAQQTLFAGAFTFAGSNAIAQYRAAGQSDKGSNTRYRETQAGFLLATLWKSVLVARGVRH